MDKLFAQSPSRQVDPRRLKLATVLILALLGILCFILSVVFDKGLSEDYVDYFSNPISIVFKPLPQHEQQPSWSLN